MYTVPFLKIPVDKLAESTNAFLDVVSVLVERSLGVTVEEVPDSSVKDRVSRLAHKIVEALSNKVPRFRVLTSRTVLFRSTFDDCFYLGTYTCY